jgi:hypothetical protein
VAKANAMGISFAGCVYSSIVDTSELSASNSTVMMYLCPESDARITSPFTIIPGVSKPAGSISKTIVEPGDIFLVISVVATLDSGPSIPMSQV